MGLFGAIGKGIGAVGKGIAKGATGVAKGVSAPFRESGDNLGIGPSPGVGGTGTASAAQINPQGQFQQTGQIGGFQNAINRFRQQPMPWNMKRGGFQQRTGTDFANAWNQQRQNAYNDWQNHDVNYHAADRDAVVKQKYDAMIAPQPQSPRVGIPGGPEGGGIGPEWFDFYRRQRNPGTPLY